MGNIGLVEKVSDTAAVFGRGVVDHARAEPDDAETYGAVGERSREINPAGNASGERG